MELCLRRKIIKDHNNRRSIPVHVQKLIINKFFNSIPFITDQQTAGHYLWGKNCDAWVLADNPDLSVKLETMPSGAKEQLHFHQQAQQFFYVLQGTAVFYMNGEKSIVRSQQGIFIESGIRHFIANESSEDLEFLVISQPSADRDRFLIEKNP